MTAKELYLYCVNQATQVVAQVGFDQLELPTPDTEWNVRQLLNHMLYELAWAGDLVTGKTIAEVGTVYDGDLLGDDFRKSWRRFELATKQSVNGGDEAVTVRLSYGDHSLHDYLLEAGTDELVHAWDLGQALGIDVTFEERAAHMLYARALEKQDSNASSGLFAAPISVAETASTQTKLLALLGRSEQWRQ